jgi:hypothetical protein
MNRKLWALNFCLLGLTVYAGVELRQVWLANKARAAAELRQKTPHIPAPPYTRPVAPPASLPANYLDIAQHDLFDRSRNPDVPVEPPPPPPPPPPMPALPVYHGAMDIGDGPMAIMSVSSSAKHEAIKPGETIGAFKLIDITRNDLTLEWDGKRIRKELWELQSHTLPVQAAAPVAQTQQAPPPKPAEPAQKGPGQMTTFGFKTCSTADTTPDGTVVDGFKKVTIATPFGSSCVWDPVSK